MDAATRAMLVQALRRQRGALTKVFVDAEADLGALEEQRPAEAEERAQRERATRMLASIDDRTRSEIALIDAALRRVSDGTYGTCVDCGGRIPTARLRALPAAAWCVECAADEESVGASSPPAEETREAGRLPADLDTLLDREVEASLRELVAQDRRLDTEELRIVCRHGVVHLAGALPSAAEHQMLLHLLSDVAGCGDVVDRVEIDELAWERPDRSRAVPREHARPLRFEPLGTEDPTESVEAGLGYVPPDRPPAEEE